MIYDHMPTFSSESKDEGQKENLACLNFDYNNKTAPFGQIQEDGKGLLLANQQLHYEFVAQYYKSARFAFIQPQSVRSAADRMEYYSKIERHITSHAPAFSHVRSVKFGINWSSFNRDDMVDLPVFGAIRALLKAWSVYPAQSRNLEIVFQDERKGKIWDILQTLEEGFSIEKLNGQLLQLQAQMEPLPQAANLKISSTYYSSFGTRNMSGYVLQDYAPCFEPLDIDNKKQETVNDIVEEFLKGLVPALV
jgi:hypothetical protein